MRFNRLAATVSALALAAPAAAYTPYHELRHMYASIDDAVAAMSSSDIHGDFNRISAILERGNVRDLGLGDAESLPSNFEPGMISALEDLSSDLRDHLDELTLEQQLTILQVVDVVAMGRIVELYDFHDCIPSPEHPCPIDLEVTPITRLNGIAVQVRSRMAAMITEYNNAPGTTDVSLPLGISAASFDGRLDLVRGTFLTIKGVESIDD